MSNENDVVRNKHLAALADAAKNYTLSEIAQIGGDSSASISYSDFTGATSISGGASGLVPAPQSGDENKFLCANGEWVDLPNSDSSFSTGIEFADAVLTGVGGLFVPSVSSVSDYLTYDDSNIQFFDNRLKNIITKNRFEICGYPDYNNRYFINDEAYVCVVDEEGKYSLESDNKNAVSLLGDTSTRDVDYYYHYKLSETVGFIIQEIDTIKSGSSYDSTASAISFKVNSAGNVSTVSSVTICPAASTTASVCGHNSWEMISSICDPNHLLFLNCVFATNSTGETETWKYNTVYIDPVNGTATATKTNTSIGVNYHYGVTSKTELTGIDTGIYIPKWTFGNGNVTISGTRVYGALSISYETAVTNAGGDVTGGGKYVLIFHGCSQSNPVSTLQLTTLSGGVTSTLNDWLEDDNNVIAGIWKSRSSSKIYAITFKKGTYSTTTPNWFDNCSTVWLFDFLTPKLLKTTKKLSEILNDLMM